MCVCVCVCLGTPLPEDLQWSQDGAEDVGDVGNAGDGADGDGDGPGEAQEHVLQYGTVVVRLRTSTATQQHTDTGHPTTDYTRASPDLLTFALKDTVTPRA